MQMLAPAVQLRQDCFNGTLVISGLPFTGMVASGPNTLSGSITGSGASYSFPADLSSGFFLLAFGVGGSSTSHSWDVNTIGGNHVSFPGFAPPSGPVVGNAYQFWTVVSLTGSNARVDLTLSLGILDSAPTRLAILEFLFEPFSFVGS